MYCDAQYFIELCLCTLHDLLSLVTNPLAMLHCALSCDGNVRHHRTAIDEKLQVLYMRCIKVYIAFGNRAGSPSTPVVHIGLVRVSCMGCVACLLQCDEEPPKQIGVLPTLPTTSLQSIPETS